MISPLFNIYDPYGELQEQAKAGALYGEDEYGMPVAKKRATITDLMPEEEKSSLLGGLANATSSGLSGLGWILDTPGSVIRGTASGLMEGDPLKGVRALWQSSDERVSGRDLLRQMGVVGDEDTWGNWAGGLVGEIALDPLSYLNPLAILGRGAAGAAGRAAGRANLLDDLALTARNAGMGKREYMLTHTPAELIADQGDEAMLRFSRAAQGKNLNPDDLLRQPLASLAELRIPGTETGVPISFGENFDRWAARSLDAAGESLATNRYTAPVVNRLTAAFDPTVMGRLDRDDQWRAREAFADARQGERDFRERLADQLLTAERASPAFNDQSIQNAIVDSIEAATPDRLASLAPETRRAINVMESVPEWRQYRDFLRDEMAGRQERLATLGVNTPYLDGDVGFFPRQQVQFTSPRKPEIPGNEPRRTRAYDRGPKVYEVSDVVGMSRRPYLQSLTREQVRRLMTGDQGGALRDRLFGASDDEIPGILDQAASEIGVSLPYDTAANASGDTIESLRSFLSDPSLTAAERAEPEQALQELERQSRQMKTQLGQLLRSADRQFADSGIGLFDRHTAADILRYGVGGVRSEANARVVTDALVNAASDIPASQMPGGGYTPLLDAAERLGYSPANLRDILADQLPGRDVASLSVPESLVNELRAVAPRTLQKERGMLGKAWDSYTNMFKVLALANPAYHSRNAYSGLLSSLTTGATNPIDAVRSAYAGWQAGRGNYEPVLNRLRNAPAFRHLTDDEIVDEFLIGGARNTLGQGLLAEGDDAIANAAPNLLIGRDAQPNVPWFGEGGLLYDPNRSWNEWATVRGVDFAGVPSDRPAPSRTLNPWLNLHERTGRRVEDALRIGTYVEGLRQGMDPDAAADLVAKSQVDYSPRAFTEFERELKRYVPFYSYTRGIAPLVAENILYRPGGLQGQVTRAVSAGSRPSDDNFVPEDLRKTTAIRLPGEYGEDGNLQRYLTKIDLPWRGLIDLISPAVGNNALESATGTVQKSAMNLLGQLNPLIKAPLEMLLDRQLYSGRELSDTYSMLEQDIGPMGRPLEQIIANSPGGSKLLGMIRTARDERLSPLERGGKILFNSASGFGVTDRDLQRAKNQAARQMLTELLKTTPGVRTYENLTIPEDVLRDLPEDQQQRYLLYKILQADSSKRAREKKKAALDPLEVLGAVR